MKRPIILTLIISFITFSCSDFLEPKSKSEFVPKDANSLNELLLGEAYPRYDVEKLNLFLYLLDDDVTAAPYQKPIEGCDPNLWLAAYTWQPKMYEQMEKAGLSNADIYFTHYSLILGANAILDYIGDVGDDDENAISLVTAQALALRGFFYFNLVNIFGQPYNSNPEGLGIPLKLNSGIEENELKRNTVKEVYEQILKDLLEAERLYLTLPQDLQWQPKYRTSLPMVQLLLSRAYLYMEDWENAATYADKVIKNNNFQLLNLNSVPTEQESEYGNIVPMYLNYHSYTNSTETIWVYANLDDVTNWVYNPYKGEEDRPFFRASDELIKSFNESTGDLRKDRYIVRSKYEMSIDGEEPNPMPQAFGKISVGEESYWQPLKGSNIFGRSLRLSEAFLNFCEAKAMSYKLNGDAEARTEALRVLNELRQNRFAPTDYKTQDISDPDALITFIHDERRRELCFEDHRWFDLRRWGMKGFTHTWYPDATSKIVYTLQDNDPSFTLPLPPSALDLNKQLEQNPLAPFPRNGELIKK